MEAANEFFESILYILSFFLGSFMLIAFLMNPKEKNEILENTKETN